MTELPQPLTPADCDLRDFQFMPLDVRRLLTSETWVLGTGDERAAAMTLWLESWHQVPAGSLPKDDRMLAHLSQSGTKWKKIRTHVLRNWCEAADGRLYHPVVAEKVLEAWIEKIASSFSGATGNAKRWGVGIETDSIKQRFHSAVEMLRAVAPQSKALKKKVVATLGVASPPDSPPESPPDTEKVSPPDRNRQGQGQGQGQGLLTTKTDSGVSTVPDQADPPRVAPLPTREDPPLSNDPAIQLSVRLRRLGVNALFTHPAVQDWATRNVPPEILDAAVARAREAKGNATIPPNYLVGIVNELLNPPPASASAVKPAREDWSWKKSDQAMNTEGAKFGIHARGGESRDDFIARIEAAKRKGKAP